MIEITPFLRSFIFTCLLLVFFYLNYYVFIPKLYITKKYILFSVSIIISFLVILYLPNLFHAVRRHNDIMPEGNPHHFPPPKHPFGLIINHAFFQFIGVLALSILLRLREQLKRIEKEKTNAELFYLKAQINPHFLFNTLNSIYSLAIQKNEQTANSIVKLSEMMRYVLSDSDTHFVSLEKELNYISNYIELQRMRLTSNVELHFDLKGDFNNKKIAPLIIIPFIENAFKHGVNSEENSKIEISIITMDTTVKLVVKNNCVTTNNNTLNKSGLGIENTKKRLALLYPESHTLAIEKSNNIFSVTLVLNIHD